MAMMMLAAGLIDGERVVHSFGDFMVMNGVLSLASGLIFGVATLLWIRSASTDVVLPALDVVVFGLLRWVNAGVADRLSSSVFSNTRFRVSHFFQETVTWLVTLAVAFAIIHHVFRRLLIRIRRADATKGNEDL